MSVILKTIFITLSLQGREENILTAKDKINGFLGKLSLWSIFLQKYIPIRVFSLCSEDCRRNCNGPIVGSSHIPCMIQSLHNLQDKVSSYFPQLSSSEGNNGHRWVINPFLNISVQLADLTTSMKENLIDLAADGILKMEFHSQNIHVFWRKRKHEYPELAREALKLLIPFATSYLCQLTFSSMLNIKTKERNRLL